MQTEFKVVKFDDIVRRAGDGVPPLTQGHMQFWDQVTAHLDSMTRGGWELIGIHTEVMMFRRRTPDPIRASTINETVDVLLNKLLDAKFCSSSFNVRIFRTLAKEALLDMHAGADEEEDDPS